MAERRPSRPLALQKLANNAIGLFKGTLEKKDRAGLPCESYGGAEDARAHDDHVGIVVDGLKSRTLAKLRKVYLSLDHSVLVNHSQKLNIVLRLDAARSSA